MATKEPIATHPILLEWVTCNADPTSYKQLSPSLHPLNIQIQVEVPVTMFVSYDADLKGGVLTPEGMAYASREITKAITKIYSTER